MTPRTKNLLLLFVAALVVIGSAAVEDWYGRFNYGADGIAYLDLSKAVHSGDWTLAASPYWSMGYPCFLASVSGLFSPDATSEWTNIRVVNLFSFLITYLGFLCFLDAGMTYLARINGAEDNGPGKRFIFIIGTCLFLVMQLTTSAVSRVSPDLLVCGIFFLINALSIRFFLQPTARGAICFGLAMGLGYLIKAILLPISIATFLVLVLHLYLRRPADRFRAITTLTWSFPAMALIAIPCIAMTSLALGRFTLGETGKLNYAWSVDGLPHGESWQGGPAPFGMPIHPTRLVGMGPPVFEFGEPFHVTYPPIFNQFYWYDGYHAFISLRGQVHQLKIDFAALFLCLAKGPHLTIKVVVELALFFSWLLFLNGQARWEWLKRTASIWPLYLPALTGLLCYLMVVLEPRYVVGFGIILTVLPFLPLFVPTELGSRRFGFVLATLFVIGGATIIGAEKTEMFQRAVVNEPYTTDFQWRIGRYLMQEGLRPNEKVASVSVGPGVYCTWAHVCGARIVIEIGNNTFDEDDQEKDFRLFTDNPDVQQRAFQLFKQAGAEWVVVRDSPVPVRGPGWELVPDAGGAWVHHLD